ncbi:MAG: heterodisulfide reductase-related iron-sulfur binding cluster, partial [Planctomycetota bacterium]
MNQSAHHPPPRLEPQRYQRGQPVALFIPCYIDQFYPSIAKATAELLGRQGVPVVYPEGQTCCGQPAFNSGYWDEARRVIHHFCDVFEPHP